MGRSKVPGLRKRGRLWHIDKQIRGYGSLCGAGLLFQALPGHLQRMALFKVNAGIRDQEVCRLRWDWEIQIPELDTSIFLIPGAFVKNREDRVVVLNEVAARVIEEVRGQHPDFCLRLQGQPDRDDASARALLRDPHQRECFLASLPFSSFLYRLAASRGIAPVRSEPMKRSSASYTVAALRRGTSSRNDITIAMTLPRVLCALLGRTSRPE
jgi:integrase